MQSSSEIDRITGYVTHDIEALIREIVSEKAGLPARPERAKDILQISLKQLANALGIRGS